MILTKKTGSNYEKHKKIMFSIIKDIFSSDIKSSIAFKGGTLCMFLYGLDRYSVDLDFDIIGNKKTLDEIKKTSRTILTKYGNISQETNTKLILKYDQDQLPLKVEFNTREYKNSQYEIKNLFGVQIIAMRPDCIFANKLVALTERKERQGRVATRDLYDIWFFFGKRRSINTDLLEERTNQKSAAYLKTLLHFIPQNFNQENILRGIGELLSEKQKYFMKTKIINEVLGFIQFEITN